MYRTLKEQLEQSIDSREVIILLGPRQVGKTTILKNLFKDKAVYIDLDDKVYRDFFDSLSSAKYRSYIDSQLGAYEKRGEKLILILDESQRLKDPGLSAKIFYDEIEGVKVILTGSAMLDIRKRTAESLAGRKITYHLYPLSFQEFLVQKKVLREDQIGSFDFSSKEFHDILVNEIQSHLFERMRVGLYPGVINASAERYLKELIDAVVLKDIFYLNLVKNTSVLIDLLKLLASLIGESINISDLAKKLGIARQTVYDYIDILEKSYIIFSLPPYKREREDEISKYNKIYFYDLGIRNALLNDFRPVNSRSDFEAIFKNFVIAEMKKLNEYYEQQYDFHYWKTTQGSEADLVLERNTLLTGFSINLYKEAFSKGFENTYPEAQKHAITLDNMHQYIL